MAVESKGGNVSKDTERHLKSIAKSLKELVSLQKGDRKGVLTEPAEIELSKETVRAISQAVTSQGAKLLTEKEQE